MTTVDLNSDMGGAFGAWRMGADAALLDIVTSANVACGLHAGDPEVHDPAFAAERAVRMVRHGAVETVSGKRLTTPVHSICVHGDTAGAVAVAGAVRASLRAARIAVRPFS